MKFRQIVSVIEREPENYDETIVDCTIDVEEPGYADPAEWFRDYCDGNMSGNDSLEIVCRLYAENDDELETVLHEFRVYEKDIYMEEEWIAGKIRNAKQWDLNDCAELCRLAGIEEEWEDADGETFEDVVYKAAEILHVDI